MRITAAVVSHAGAPFVLQEVDLEAPRSDEVLVQLHASGICHTDASAQAGDFSFPFPAVLGHEGAGVVIEVGKSVTKVAPGDHVVMTFGSCGTCANCNHGHQAYCVEAAALNVSGRRYGARTAYSMDGSPIAGHFFGQSSFATHSITKERNLVSVDKSLALELLAPLGCGIQTGAGAVLNETDAGPGSRLAVLGTGSVGLSSIMAAQLSGCSVIIAVDLKEERMKIAEQLGATHAVNGNEPHLADKLKEITGGELDYIVDYTSVPPLLKSVMPALKRRGTLLLGGAAKPHTVADFDMNSILIGRSVRGMVRGDSVPDTFIPKLIAHHQAGRFPFDKIISLYDFSNINEATRDSIEGKTIKPVLRMR